MKSQLVTQQHNLQEAVALIAKGDRHFKEKNFESSIPFYSQAIELRRAALGEEHEDLAVALNRLANAYYQLNDNASAQELFERALAIREAVLPPDAPELRLSVNNLANVYRNLGRFAEAEPLYLRSLRMKEQETGHINHQEIWRNLVRVFEGQGKVAEAAEYIKRIRALEDEH